VKPLKFQKDKNSVRDSPLNPLYEKYKNKRKGFKR